MHDAARFRQTAHRWRIQVLSDRRVSALAFRLGLLFLEQPRTRFEIGACARTIGACAGDAAAALADLVRLGHLRVETDASGQTFALPLLEGTS